MARTRKEPELPLHEKDTKLLVKELKEHDLVFKTLKPAYDKLYQPYPPQGYYGVIIDIENKDLNRRLMRLESSLVRMINHAGFMCELIRDELKKRKKRRGT